MEKLVELARRFWPGLTVLVVSTAIATAVGLSVQAQGPPWWAARDWWDALSLLTGVTLGALAAVALVYGHFRRKAQRDALLIHVRLDIQQHVVDGELRAIAWVDLRIPGAWTYSQTWNVVSATAKFHVLDDIAIHDREPEVRSHGGTDVSFRLKHDFELKRAIDIARKIPAGGDWVNATSLVVLTNHREFRYQQYESRLYLSPDVLNAARCASTSPVERTPRPAQPVPAANIEKLSAELVAADEAKQRADWADDHERIASAKAATDPGHPRRAPRSVSTASKAKELARKHRIWPDVRARLLWLSDEHRACDQQHARDERRFRRVHDYTCDLLSRAFSERHRDSYRHAFGANAKHATPLDYGPERALDLLCHSHARYLQELAEDAEAHELRSRFVLDPQPEFGRQ